MVMETKMDVKKKQSTYCHDIVVTLFIKIKRYVTKVG